MAQSRISEFLFIPCVLLSSAVCGCGPDLVLEGEDGGIRLAYDCESFSPQAESNSEHALVRDHALRLVARAVQDETLDDVRHLLTADAEGNTGLVERIVVERLCEEGGEAAMSDEEWVEWAALTEGPKVTGPDLVRGDLAPGFELPVLDSAYFRGRPTLVNLSALRGSYVFLAFGGTGCSPCLAEHLELQSVWDEMEPRGLKMFWIVQKGDEIKAHQWLSINAPESYPTLVDSIFRTMTAYHVRGIPRSFLIGPSGDIAQEWLGWGPDATEDFSQAMDQLLPGTPDRAP